MVDPKLLCRQHLYGEHVELHMFVGTIEAGKSLKGFQHLVEVHNLESRHADLVEEMFRRGYYGHQTPLIQLESELFGSVDKELSLRTLYERCLECRNRIWHYQQWWVEKWLSNAS